MSNPGVIILAEKYLSAVKNFRIEDNLGEAIHIHYANIRLDFSVKDFLYIADNAANAVNGLLKESKFRIEDYDIEFLNTISDCISDLERIEYAEVSAVHLRLRDSFLNLPITKTINKNVKPERSKQEDKKNDTVILFNNSPVIMYGENTALKALKNNPNANLTITRFVFTKGRHSVRKNPWIDYLFKWNKKRIYRFLRKTVKKIFK
ncbi:hypothetical protein FACS1894147_05770 [Spirochaetia bacterium]|nr:hypothetical protein FACS1894147_05770 [Spirochaetia bacterium]